ncbi:MAG TPA: hypothetical protein VFC46_09420 [Humisphaera sp.]|nr:hypothetical protein [Humisphaera sp.]
MAQASGLWLSQAARLCYKFESHLQVIFAIAQYDREVTLCIDPNMEAVMNEKNESIPPLASSEGVAGELIDELHQANEKLTRAREHVEAANNAETNVLIERERASREVHDVEAEIEKADEKIRQAMKENQKR